MDTFKDILTGLFTNGLWDFIKVILGTIFGWFGHKYYNQIYIEGKKNKITQKGNANFSKVKGDNNDISQSN